MTPEPLVFIVDDDAAVRGALQRLCEAAGFTVRAFGAPEEFLESVTPQSRGCVVLDFHMPGLDGLAVLGALRQRGLTLPALVVTASANSHGLLRQVAMAGAAAIIEKPFRPDDLLARIREMLNT